MGCIFVIIVKIAHAELDLLQTVDRHEVKVSVTLSLNDEAQALVGERSNLDYRIIKHECLDKDLHVRIRFPQPIESVSVLSRREDSISVLKIQLPTRQRPIKL